MIQDVVLHDLITHVDERGFFREIIRVTDDFFEGFGQWSHALMYHGVAKAWHVHREQTDWWYVIGGPLKVALHDLRPASPTYRQTMEFFMGDGQPARVLKIPPGVAHGCKVVGETAHLFYVTSHTYNPADEGRLAHDDPTIGYDWVSGPAIK